VAISGQSIHEFLEVKHPMALIEQRSRITRISLKAGFLFHDIKLSMGALRLSAAARQGVGE